MAVRRIVANVATNDLSAARAFYGELLGMEVVMDLGWIATFAGDGAATPQLSFMSDAGSGAPVPALSIEVDDVDAVHRRVVAAGIGVEYGPADEPWGVRRFYVRDPFGRLLNFLTHTGGHKG